MPSTSRRQFLAAVGGAVGVASLAGCSALPGNRGGPPDVNTGSSLAQNTSAALDTEAVFLAGDVAALPDPPDVADSVESADLVLAAADADRATLTEALHDGKPVAVAGDGCQDALRGLLASVREAYTYGVEAVRSRDVAVAVADPRGDTVETYTMVAAGGWTDEPVLAPLGWTLVGRVPDCQTFVPESSRDDVFAYAGGATVAGRLPTGETYACRTVASVAEQSGERFVRLRSTLHAAANDGFAVDEAVREASFPDDKRLDQVWPNANTRQGVQVGNYSDTLRSEFEIRLAPTNDRARAALTGCGGLETRGSVDYDFRVAGTWRRNRLLGDDRHEAAVTGRGEWSFAP